MAVWTPQSFAAHLGEAAAATSALLAEDVNNAGEMLQRDAMDSAPISADDSGSTAPGTLRASIELKSTRATVNPAVEVEVTADYGRFPEYGTSSQAPQHYMLRATESVAPIFAADVAATVKAAI